MGHLELATEITAPVVRCFDLSRDIDVHRESMSASGERAIRGITRGQINLGEEVTWSARHFGLRWQVTSRITEFDRPSRFVDEMQRGPFSRFRHEHRFESHGPVTAMVDVVDYSLPLGLAGQIADRLVVGGYLRRLLEARNGFIRDAAESGRTA